MITFDAEDKKYLEAGIQSLVEAGLCVSATAGPATRYPGQLVVLFTEPAYQEPSLLMYLKGFVAGCRRS